MTKYINYWLKNMIKDTPNDMELGEKLREISWKQTKKQIVKDKNQLTLNIQYHKRNIVLENKKKLFY